MLGILSSLTLRVWKTEEIELRLLSRPPMTTTIQTCQTRTTLRAKLNMEKITKEEDSCATGARSVSTIDLLPVSMRLHTKAKSPDVTFAPSNTPIATPYATI